MDPMSEMIAAHPKGQVPDVLKNVLTETAACQSACVMCADACLSEPDVQMLVNCIALTLDCADICAATFRVAGRIGHHFKSANILQLDACREFCRLCAEECERHEHEHCRVCAQACRRCEDACSALLERARGRV